MNPRTVQTRKSPTRQERKPALATVHPHQALLPLLTPHWGACLLSGIPFMTSKPWWQETLRSLNIDSFYGSLSSWVVQFF